MLINKRAWAAAVALVAVLLLAAPAAASELPRRAERGAPGLWERAWSWLLDSWAAVAPQAGLRIEWAAHGGTIDPDG